MKLLLRKDVAKLGIVGDVVEVSAGYARNYLIPHHLAAEPTTANIKAIAEERKQAIQRRAMMRETMTRAAARLANAEVTISAAANEDGHLYGSVGPREIAAALRDEGHDVLPQHVDLHQPIRRLDNTVVPIVFADDIKAEVKVWVVRERRAGEVDEEEGAKTE